jgi:hypothetical protein
VRTFVAFTLFVVAAPVVLFSIPSWLKGEWRFIIRWRELWLIAGALFILYVGLWAKALWLEVRLWRRLSDMNRRVGAGEHVRASEVRL